MLSRGSLLHLGSSGSQIGPGESSAFIAGRVSWRIDKSPRVSGEPGEVVAGSLDGVNPNARCAHLA